MRGQHQSTLNSPKRGVLRKRLTGENIQTGTSDHPLVDRFSDGGFIHHTATGTVHDPRTGLHRPQQLRVHQVLGVLGARNVQRDVIGGSEQLSQVGQPNLHLLSTIRSNKWVVRNHLHPHGPGNLGHMGSDLAETHHTKGLFVELITDVFFTVPLPDTHAGMGLGHMPGNGEHHRQSMLRSGDGVALGRIHNQNPALGGGGHIHVVHAHTGSANDLETRRRRDDLRRDLSS